MDTSSKNIFKILIVDDNPNNIQVIGNILREQGFSIGYALNGEQTLNILQKTQEYDMILLDVDMPIMDGYDTCREIRKSELLKDIPIIFLTAHNEADSIIKAFELGAQDYVSKPFNSKELLARVNTHLQLKHKTEIIRDMNKTLEKTVEERTFDLKEAKTKLEVLEKAKTDVLALLSHELRTPLNGILGISQLLRMSAIEDDDIELIDNIIASAKKLTKLSETALLITDLKLLKQKHSLSQVDIVPIINNAIEESDDLFIKRSVQIFKHFDFDSCTLSLADSLLNTAIKSILDNAVIYTYNNCIITIRLAIENGFVKLCICDNGPGFAEDALAQLFEIFTASDIIHHSEGFGLSLAAVKLIMDIHGGQAEVFNKDKGACVSLWFPVIEL